MNATLNSSSTVHSIVDHDGQIIGTRCSAESLGKPRPRRYRKTTEAITCKRCLKMAAARNEAPAAPAAAEVRELITFNVGSKRTRTSGPRHPLERDNSISGLGF